MSLLFLPMILSNTSIVVTFAGVCYKNCYIYKSTQRGHLKKCYIRYLDISPRNIYSSLEACRAFSAIHNNLTIKGSFIQSTINVYDNCIIEKLPENTYNIVDHSCTLKDPTCKYILVEDYKLPKVTNKVEAIHVNPDSLSERVSKVFISKTLMCNISTSVRILWINYSGLEKVYLPPTLAKVYIVGHPTRPPYIQGYTKFIHVKNYVEL